MRREPPIALFDMDGTLCDYQDALFRELEKLRSPKEKPFDDFHMPVLPQYIKNRMDLIRSSEAWWSTLPKYSPGWEILRMVKKIGYRVVILTQGPRRNPVAWSGKKQWIDKYLGEDTDIIITRDKGLVYGRILVDDYPPYIKKWLAHRPRGLAVMPGHQDNISFRHPQVLPYPEVQGKRLQKLLQDAADRP
jgi:5'-nucleotidase